MKVLVVAPHPDDELLGCGGTLLQYLADGATLGWIIVTSMTEALGWQPDAVGRRAAQVEQVRQCLKIERENHFQLNFPPSGLDSIPLSEIVGRISGVFESFAPDVVFVPHPGDAHSDHRVSFDAAIACTKWFRSPSIKRVLSYETVSETDAGLDLTRPFQPTVFYDVSNTIDQKCQLLQIYESEIDEFPFPRSEKNIRALAAHRGAQVGFVAAEAFSLLRERKVFGE